MAEIHLHNPIFFKIHTGFCMDFLKHRSLFKISGPAGRTHAYLFCVLPHLKQVNVQVGIKNTFLLIK